MNGDRASFDDILSLIHLAEKTVEEKFGIDFEGEVHNVE
jgi:UDP-N-acetylenolpyruvoylglucosamine reductase